MTPKRLYWEAEHAYAAYVGPVAAEAEPFDRLDKDEQGRWWEVAHAARKRVSPEWQTPAGAWRLKDSGEVVLGALATPFAEFAYRLVYWVKDRWFFAGAGMVSVDPKDNLVAVKPIARPLRRFHPNTLEVPK